MVEVADVKTRSEYPVLPECPAKYHNSLSSASGRYLPEKCICPHAIALLAKRHEARRDDHARKRGKGIGARTSNIKLSAVAPKPISSPNYPDFSGGLCTTKHGMAAAQDGMDDTATLRGIAARERAKALCNAGPCPIRDTICRPWVFMEESPAGSWGGVWGGFDPWNRKGEEVVIIDGKAAVVPYPIVIDGKSW